jgi:hypothetical protein
MGTPCAAPSLGENNSRFTSAGRGNDVTVFVLVNIGDHGTSSNAEGVLGFPFLWKDDHRHPVACESSGMLSYINIAIPHLLHKAILC